MSGAAGYNQCAMIESYLVPEKTRVSEKGDGAAADVSSATNRVFLATLEISDVVEQESLDVSIFTSADGQTWGAKPVAAFPQQFYRGQVPVLVDLTAEADAKFIRAHWEVNRWGRGPEKPDFEFGVALKEVPADLLKEAREEASARK
jgi:hypothetical protein